MEAMRQQTARVFMREKGYVPDFEVYDYLVENQNPTMSSQFSNLNIESKDDFHLKTDCYYMMKFEHVFGTLIMKKDCMVFQPNYSSELNFHLVRDHKNPANDLKQYEAVIDYMDVIEANKMNLVNEQAVISENSYIREAYKFEIFA